MNRRKLSDKEIKLLLIFFSLLLLGGSYFFVYDRFHIQTLEMKEKNIEMEAELRHLKSMVLKEKEVETETRQMEAESQLIVNKIPSLVTQEKAIYIVDEMEKILGIKIQSIGFSMNEVLKEGEGTEEEPISMEEAISSTQEAVDGITAEPEKSQELQGSEEKPQIIGYASKLQMQYTASYSQLKEMLHYIAKYEDRMTLEKIDAVFDTETGNLMGTMEVAMYSLEGTEREYQAPVINGISQGVSNIMGSKEH
ncbi:MAG: hypothetical protein RSJ40_09385 [Acetivibrio sp.]